MISFSRCPFIFPSLTPVGTAAPSAAFGTLPPAQPRRFLLMLKQQPPTLSRCILISARAAAEFHLGKRSGMDLSAAPAPSRRWVGNAGRVCGSRGEFPGNRYLARPSQPAGRERGAGSGFGLCPHPLESRRAERSGRERSRSDPAAIPQRSRHGEHRLRPAGSRRLPGLLPKETLAEEGVSTPLRLGAVGAGLASRRDLSRGMHPAGISYFPVGSGVLGAARARDQLAPSAWDGILSRLAGNASPREKRHCVNFCLGN